MTRRRIIDIVEEPPGDVLRRLLLAGAALASHVMLVLRKEDELQPSGQALLSRLEPHLVERKRSASWPGTELIGHEATVLVFDAGEEVIAELLAACDRLYSWLEPDLPEDLALVRTDGSPVVASIAHERDAYLEVSDEDFLVLVQRLPGILKILRPQS